jgi:putative MATE family efflux protein
MKDLTEGSISGNILAMAGPIAAGMIFQTLYLLVDLYFVAAIGDAAVAGVGAAGTLMFFVMAFTQVLGVGAVSLISRAVGRKDAADANLVFNQSLGLAALCAGVTFFGGYAVAGTYMGSIAADAAARDAGLGFLYCFIPGLALQFALVTMGSALRGTGIVKPTMIVQALTVLLNTALAPVLIAGWVTGLPLGVVGAGLASTISISVGVLMLTLYFVKLEKYVSFDRALWSPRLETWKRMLDVGLPAGGEFAIMFVYMAIVYWLIQDFGAPAQAGFSIGGRVMQSIFLPAMAIAFAAGPVAGQNFGAAAADRVRETLSKGVMLSSIVMLCVTVFMQWRPEVLIAFFTSEAAAQEVGADFLRIISLNFVAQGIVFTCSGIFQGIGLFAPVAVLLSTRDGFTPTWLWYWSVVTVFVQAFLSWMLLRAEFRKRLGALPPTDVPPAPAAESL